MSDSDLKPWERWTPDEYLRSRNLAFANLQGEVNGFINRLEDKNEKLRKLVVYLGDFAEEQGADFGMFADSEPELFDIDLFDEVRSQGVRS